MNIDIKSYISKFDTENRLEEDALSIIFKTFPNNNCDTDIYIKASLLNNAYHTGIKDKDLHILCKHIASIDNLDSLIDKGNFSAVLQIGLTPSSINNCFSFASKYCSWHNPDAFPIMDRFSRGSLYSFCSIKNHKIKKRDLYDYFRYVEIYQQFISLCDFHNISYKDIDKFLWLYGKEHNLSIS